jgi:hypothetical protein
MTSKLALPKRRVKGGSWGAWLLLAVFFFQNNSYAYEDQRVLALSYVIPRGQANEALLIDALEQSVRKNGLTTTSCKSVLNLQASLVEDFERALIDTPQARDKTLGIITEKLLATGCMASPLSSTAKIYVAEILVDVDAGLGNRRAATVIFYELGTETKLKGRHEEPANTDPVHQNWAEIIDNATNRAITGTNASPTIDLEVTGGLDVTGKPAVGRALALSAKAYDPDGDPLSFTWLCSTSLTGNDASRLQISFPGERFPRRLPPDEALADKKTEDLSAGDDPRKENLYLIGAAPQNPPTTFACPIPITNHIEVRLVVNDSHNGPITKTRFFPNPSVSKRWSVNLVYVSNLITGFTGPGRRELQVEGTFSLYGRSWGLDKAIENLAVLSYELGGRFTQFSADPTQPIGTHALSLGGRSSLSLGYRDRLRFYVSAPLVVVFVPNQPLSLPNNEVVRVKSKFKVGFSRFFFGVEKPPSDLFSRRMDGQGSFVDCKGTFLDVFTCSRNARAGVGVRDNVLYSDDDSGIAIKTGWLLYELSVGIRF